MVKIRDVDKEIIDEGPPPPAPSVIRIAKMNAPEWKLILLGLVGAAGAGVIMPVFSIVFSKLLRVRLERFRYHSGLVCLCATVWFRYLANLVTRWKMVFPNGHLYLSTLG